MRRNQMKEVGYVETERYSCLEDLELTYTFSSIDPLYLAYCGMENCRPGHSFGPYIRDNYLIHVITDGTGTYYTDGKELKLSAGDAFIIYPGKETTYQADFVTPWTYLWVGFNGYQSETVANEIGFSREHPVVRFQDCSQFRPALERIFEARVLTVANSMKRRASFYEMMAEMMEQSTIKNTEIRLHSDKYVRMAVDMITASFDKKVRISDIADQIGVNRSYLTSIFKRDLGMSPQEFLISYRLEKSAQMLKDSVEPINNIAAAVGYADPLTFSKAFKQRFGVSPSLYRNMLPELIERGNDEGGAMFILPATAHKNGVE